MQSLSKVQPSREAIEQAAVYLDSKLTEVRIMCSDGIVSQYYSDAKKLAATTFDVANVPDAYVCWTLNEIAPSEPGKASNDKSVVAYRHLFIDCDPVRPAGTSSTDAEKEAALKVAEQFREFLKSLNISSILADSGNGLHVLVPLAIPKSDASIHLVKKTIHAISARFSTPAVKIDTSVYNPARIVKAYGTVAKKGKATEERPHRVSGLIDAPEITNRLDESALQSLFDAVFSTLSPEQQAAINTPPQARAAAVSEGEIVESLVNLKRELKNWGVKWTREKLSSDGEVVMLFLSECPFPHKSGTQTHEATWAGVNAAGQWCFDCKHESCEGKGWKEFRAEVDPFYEDYSLPSYVEHRSGSYFCAPEMILENGTLVSESPLIVGYKDNYINLATFGNELVLEEGEEITLSPSLKAVLVVKGNRVTCTTEKRESSGMKIMHTVGFDDWGLALRWLEVDGANHRYCSSTDTWMYYNGRVWCEDKGLNAHKSFKRVLRGLAATATGAEKKFLAKVQTNSRQMAVISTARFEEGVSVSQAAFDRGDYYLNVLNGVIRFDRNTGAVTFGPHFRGDYARKLAPLTYDPNATCPAFDAWFEWFQPDANVRAFILQYFGLALAGISPRAFMVLLGTGGNGKGTLVSLLCQMFGSVLTPIGELEGAAYSCQPDMTTFTSNVELSPSSHRADLVPFMGARLIAASETNPSSGSNRVKLNTAFLKRYTGGSGEYISLRGAYDKVQMNFKPAGVIVLQTNAIPDLGDDSDGLWERVKLVPCNSTFIKKDGQLIERLLTESSGILNRLIAGLQACLQAGELNDPKLITDATKAYRTSDSPVRSFLDEECDAVEGACVLCSTLYARFKTWFQENRGEYPPKQREFTEQLKAALHIKLVHTMEGNCVPGLKLKREEKTTQYY